MNDAELADLKVWAQRRNPAIPRWAHFYHAACPFCRSESTDPEDGPGRHDVALALIEEVERLRDIVAALTAEDMLTEEEVARYRRFQARADRAETEVDRLTRLLTECRERP